MRRGFADLFPFLFIYLFIGFEAGNALEFFLFLGFDP